jgi:hypothetical protein
MDCTFVLFRCRPALCRLHLVRRHHAIGYIKRVTRLSAPPSATSGAPPFVPLALPTTSRGLHASPPPPKSDAPVSSPTAPTGYIHQVDVCSPRCTRYIRLAAACSDRPTGYIQHPSLITGSFCIKSVAASKIW